MAKVEQWVCIPATIQYTIWSDVYRCEGFVTIEEPTGKVSTRGKNAGKPMVTEKARCTWLRGEIVLWNAAVDRRPLAQFLSSLIVHTVGKNGKSCISTFTETIPVACHTTFGSLHRPRREASRLA